MLLEQLYLDNMNINGTLDITNMQTIGQRLQVLSLTNNDITNVIYSKSLLAEGHVIVYLQGNPYCQGSLFEDHGKMCFCAQYCILPSSFNKSDWKVIVISTTISGFLLGIVTLVLGIMLHRSKKHVHVLLKNIKELDIKAKRFEYNELHIATKNFAKERKLGAGAYGVVYKGILANNIEVAVKQLFIKTKQDTSGAYLCQVMNWSTRMKICLGVAQGLYYLHVSSQTRIIHRDIKASNILLDKDLNPKIADFGLARPIRDGRTEIVTQQCVGTIGYLAPEYILYGQLSDKADVYSFGVLLLETISGKKNQDPTPSEVEVYLPRRAWKLYTENRLMDLVDPRLQFNNSEFFEVQRILETTILCVQISPEKRPTMFRAVAMLGGDATIVISNEEGNEWPNFQPNKSSDQDPFLDLQSTLSSSTIGHLANESINVELNTFHTR
ncbi:hypothetical protein BDL97_13G121200 [Sphagnum fallax]|nr:hypothetical protein BDL97_13G121200 [Sphagnum fallax]